MTAIHPDEDPMGLAAFLLPDVPRIEHFTRYECPKCGSDQLNVTVQCWARLTQETEGGEYTFETDIDTSAQDWDSESAMHCLECGNGGKVSDFAVEGEALTNAN